MLLKELTALRGVSGDEGEVRSFIVDQAAPWCDEIKVDNMGSVIAWKHSKVYPRCRYDPLSAGARRGRGGW